MNTMKKTLLLALALGLPASAAFAHAHLKAETPAASAVIAAAPRALVLRFSEDVALAFTGVTVTGPARAAVKLGHGTLSAGDTVLTVPVEGSLAPGRYEVAWHALSKDGHKTHGTYSFSVK